MSEVVSLREKTPEFTPVIIEGDELRTWRPESSADFGFIYGNLSGEHWGDNLHTVFHPNVDPLIVNDRSYDSEYNGEVVVHDEWPTGSPTEIVQEATTLLLKNYKPSWLVREFNKQQAERAE